MDRCDALQQPAGLVEGGQCFRVVGSCVVRDDRGLAGLGFSLESFQREDRLLGVPVLLDRVRRDFFAGRGEGAGEGLGRLLPVHGRSGALSFRGLHAAGPGLVLGAGLVCRVDLPAGVQQGLDSGRRLGRASGGGFLVAVLVERVGRFGVRPAQGREQPVGGVRLVFGVGQGLHDLAQGRGVPEPGAGARPGGRPGQNSLGFLLLGAGGFRRVLVPRGVFSGLCKPSLKD